MPLVTYELTEGVAILLEDAVDVAILSMNRPAALNGLNEELITALGAATARAAADTEARVVILRSSSRHFMAGGDLKYLSGEISGRDAAAIEVRVKDLAEAHHRCLESIVGT